MKTLVKMVFGSQLFGTSTPASDTDYKAVHLESMDRVLLNRTREVVTYGGRSKMLGEKNTAADVDFESYEVNKFVDLLCEGQTVALDMLFAPPQFWVEHHFNWQLLVDNRQLFLSKNAKSFIGYCRTQAHKYGLKGSRVAAARAAVDFLGSLYVPGVNSHKTLRDFEIEIRVWVLEQKSEFIKIVEPNETNKETMLEICNRKSQWGNSIKNTHEMYVRLLAEYGTRALQAESNEGIDWKALSHAVRIGQEAVELFETGNLTFPRPNAQYLLSVKRGEVDYNTVSNEIDQLLADVEAASARSSLPEKVDREKIDKLVLYMYRNDFARSLKND